MSCWRVVHGGIGLMWRDRIGLICPVCVAGV